MGGITEYLRAGGFLDQNKGGEEGGNPLQRMGRFLGREVFTPIGHASRWGARHVLPTNDDGTVNTPDALRAVAGGLIPAVGAVNMAARLTGQEGRLSRMMGGRGGGVDQGSSGAPSPSRFAPDAAAISDRAANSLSGQPRSQGVGLLSRFGSDAQAISDRAAASERGGAQAGAGTRPGVGNAGGNAPAPAYVQGTAGRNARLGMASETLGSQISQAEMDAIIRSRGGLLAER